MWTQTGIGVIAGLLVLIIAPILKTAWRTHVWPRIVRRWYPSVLDLSGKYATEYSEEGEEERAKETAVLVH